MPFAMWKEERCGFCGKEAGKLADPDNLPYRLVCPICLRDGCEECMPMGRGCECPECEKTT